jgi:hypothetical protein
MVNPIGENRSYWDFDLLDVTIEHFYAIGDEYEQHLQRLWAGWGVHHPILQQKCWVD